MPISKKVRRHSPWRMTMTRVRLPLLCVLGLLFACAEPSPEVEGPPAAGMSLLFVTLDTTRPDVLTPYGGDPLVSPTLAGLAAKSALFTHAYSEMNITNPSHLSLFSGLRAIDHGVLNNASPVPDDVDTLPEALQRAGYRTAGFPAAPHIVNQAKWRGFDHLGRADSPLDADTITEAAVAWIRENADERYFAWVHYYDPHAIYRPLGKDTALFYQGDPRAGDRPLITEAPYFVEGVKHDPFIRMVAEWLDSIRDPNWAPAMYRAEIRYVDRNLARLLWELDDLGVAARTVIVIVGDHGESLGEHGLFYSHRGLYEPELRIPLLIHVPGWPGTRSDAFVSTLDLDPTIRGLIGVGSDNLGEGRSLVPLIEGADDVGLSAPDVFVHQGARNEVVAVRRDGWKLVLPLMEDHWLLSRGVELYHVEEDPGEVVNLAGSEPARVEELRAHATRWIDLGPRPGVAPQLSEKDEESLRALGYLED
jgi:arylsulfatase